MANADMGHPHGQEERRELVLELAPEARSVTRARQWVVDAATEREVSAGTVERLALVVTELASNAVLHARSPFRVSVTFDESVIRGTVSDPESTPPMELDPAPRATAGRGLMLVRRVAARSGVDTMPSGKSVWFEVDDPG